MKEVEGLWDLCFFTKRILDGSLKAKGLQIRFLREKKMCRMKEKLIAEMPGIQE